MQKIIQTLQLQIWGSERDGSTFSQEISPCQSLSVTGQRRGTEDSCYLFRLMPSVPRTEGNVYGLLPTPMASDFKVGRMGSQQNGRKSPVKGSFPPSQ